MYKVNKPKKGCAVSIADLRLLNILEGNGIFKPEDVLNPSPEQLKVLLELGVDMGGIVAGRGE